MTAKPTIYDFPEIYEKLGMELGHFGCIMLDVEPLPIQQILDVEDDWFYYSKKDTLRYVKGPVGAVQAHATLLYGLTPNDTAGIDQKESVDLLLQGLDLSEVTIHHIDSFPPQDKSEHYSCVVAHLDVEDNDLVEANRRLRFLPHIDSFVEYKAHVTLAYVREEETEETISKLSAELEGLTIPAIGINYGGALH